MNTNELKIGNLVLVNGEAKPLSVLEVDYFGYIDPIDPKPLKLDTLWFDLFSFTKLPMGWVKDIDETLSLEITETKEGFYPKLWQDDAQITLHEIEYVHELQNLWYVLAKDEL